MATAALGLLGGSGGISSLLSSILPGLLQNNPLTQLMQGLTQAFQGLEKKHQYGNYGQQYPSQPQPFSQGQFNINIGANPMGSFQGFNFNATFGMGMSGGSGFMTGGSGGGMNGLVGRQGPRIDSMFQQAQSLMGQEDMQSQLKGQMMMQQAMKMFENVSKAIEQMGQAQSKALQAIK
jgi:hypothetical protein